MQIFMINYFFYYSLANKHATIITATHSAKPIIQNSRLRQFVAFRRLSFVTYNFSPLRIQKKNYTNFKIYFYFSLQFNA